MHPPSEGGPDPLGDFFQLKVATQMQSPPSHLLPRWAWIEEISVQEMNGDSDLCRSDTARAQSGTDDPL
jgi:hypothetical protein